MNKSQTKKQIPDKALKLLPWYATGWVSPKERDYVQKTITEYPEYRDLLDSEHKIIKAVKEDISILDQSCLESTEIRLEKLLQQLPDKKNQDNKTSNKSKQSILEYLLPLFSGYSPKWQHAVFATMTMLTIALLFAFVSPLMDENNTYYPATSSIKMGNNSDTTTLLVGLNTEPNDPELLRLLKANNVKIDAMLGKSGMYRLSLSGKLSTEETKTLLNKLTDNKELFWFAGEEF